MHIADLLPADEALTAQVAALLIESFREHWPDAWPDLDSALAEVHESFGPGRISRVAIDGDGSALGWIGGIEQYDGKVWELHPLAVRPDRRLRGIGRALVADLEARVAERGGLTVILGTDDEDGMTSLAGVDLYEDLPGQLARIRNLKEHPFEFYLKCGFVVSGVVPDANGRGKPDILMARRVGY